MKIEHLNESKFTDKLKQLANKAKDTMFDDEEITEIDLSDDEAKLIEVANNYSNADDAMDACIEYLFGNDKVINDLLTRTSGKQVDEVSEEDKQAIDSLIDELDRIIKKSKVSSNERHEFVNNVKNRVNNFKDKVVDVIKHPYEDDDEEELKEEMTADKESFLNKIIKDIRQLDVDVLVDSFDWDPKKESLKDVLTRIDIDNDKLEEIYNKAKESLATKNNNAKNEDLEVIPTNYDGENSIVLNAANDVMDAYQNANKWLDTTKEAVYTDLGCVFFSSFIHNLAHTMPQRFDKFGDILHTCNIKVPYPPTNDVPFAVDSIDSAFKMVFTVLDDIKARLNVFIKSTDEDFHGMSCAAEVLLNEIEAEYPMLYRLRQEWENCANDMAKFDKYVGQYVNSKDNLLESFGWPEDPRDNVDYNPKHAEEWMEKHPYGWYNSESDYGTGDEEDLELSLDEAENIDNDLTEVELLNKYRLNYHVETVDGLPNIIYDFTLDDLNKVLDEHPEIGNELDGVKAELEGNNMEHKEVEEEVSYGSVKYNANDGRKARIADYRAFAGLKDEDLIEETNLDDYALRRTASKYNCGLDRVKAEILGQKWSDYEI